MKFNVSILFFSLLTISVFAKTNTYNVKDYIHTTGKTVLITSDIQSLIDKCYTEGGGTIFFPNGEYLIGTIKLKSNIFIDLASGCTIYGSTNIADYYAENSTNGLIISDSATNFGIIGTGTINGQGDFFWRNKEKPYNRPDRLIFFENSNYIHIKNVKITNSPNWNIELEYCSWIWIDGISIINEMKSPNTDGIDPTSCKNIFISNCYIETGDDAICPKSKLDAPTDNLVVTNCILISDDTALKFGTASNSNIQNAVFNNIIIRNTRYGIAFYAKDGGTFQNIQFNNIRIETTKDYKSDTKPSGSFPIFIDLEKRNSKSELGFVKNIYFSNITIDTEDGNCLFLGQPEHQLENIFLSNIHFTLHKRKTFEGKTKPRGVSSLTERASNDFSDVPSHFTFAHVTGLYIDNLFLTDLSDNENNERYMIWGNDIHETSITNFRNKTIVSNKKFAQFYFNESSSIEIKLCTPAISEKSFVSFEGSKTKDIIIHMNNLRNINKVFDMDKTINKNEIIETNNIK